MLEGDLVEQFRIMYKVLKHLADSMDCDELDLSPVSPDSIGASRNMWLSVIGILFDNGYIDGISKEQLIHQNIPTYSGLENMKITLKGLEYLQENSLMQRMARIAKGIK